MEGPTPSSPSLPRFQPWLFWVPLPLGLVSQRGPEATTSFSSVQVYPGSLTPSNLFLKCGGRQPSAETGQDHRAAVSSLRASQTEVRTPRHTATPYRLPQANLHFTSGKQDTEGKIHTFPCPHPLKIQDREMWQTEWGAGLLRPQAPGKGNWRKDMEPLRPSDTCSPFR